MSTRVRNSFLLAAAVVIAACHNSSPAGGSAMKAAPAAAKPATPTLPVGVTTAMIAEGDSIFNVASCQRCHGQKAVGGNTGPTLIRTEWYHGSGSHADIVKTINTGVPKAEVHDPKFQAGMGMRAQAANFTPAQINALGAYVWSLNHPH